MSRKPLTAEVCGLPLLAGPETAYFDDDSTPDYLTSDTHLGHANILEYCPNRHAWSQTRDGILADIGHHDDTIIKSWWEVVDFDSTVLHLGDFAFGNAEQVAAYRRRLTGHVSIVCGNHDRSATSMAQCGFPVASRRAIFRLAGVGIVICRHRPKDFTAEEAEVADALFHGHTHSTAAQTNHHAADDLQKGVARKLFDVGVDRWGPAPRRTPELGLLFKAHWGL